MSDKKFTLSIMSSYSQSECFTTISCGFMNLILTGQPITLPVGFSDTHEFYEFLIPLTPIPRLFVEGRDVDCQPGHVVPINPGQHHGVRAGRKGVSYILIVVCQDTMCRLIRQISGSTFNCFFPVGAYPLRTDIQHLISRLIQESNCNDCGREILMNCLAEELSVLLIRHYYQPPAQSSLAIPEHLIGDQARFREVITLMQENYADRLSVEDFAQRCGMNCFHFIRSFKRVFNISPYNFLTRIRISNAKQLLIQSNLPASEVGRQCGFQSASRFSAVFQKDTGMTPSRYRKEHNV